MQSVVYKRIPRLDPVLIERAKRINVADLHEGLGPAVLTNGGSPQGALLGEIATYCSQVRKVGGAVIDGAKRDTLEITEMAFPVFASHISVSYPGKRGPGAVNEPAV